MPVSVTVVSDGSRNTGAVPLYRDITSVREEESPFFARITGAAETPDTSSEMFVITIGFLSGVLQIQYGFIWYFAVKNIIQRKRLRRSPI